MRASTTGERGTLGPVGERYINREFSWLQFNGRVLAEAESTSNPLLERMKFLAIYESNLDEFYMVRVSGLIEQVEGEVQELTPEGLKPGEQLRVIADEAVPQRLRAAAIWTEDLAPALERAGVKLLAWGALSDAQQMRLREWFLQEPFWVCTPVKLHPAQSVPHVSNRSLNLAVVLRDESEFKIARVKVPSIVPRLVAVEAGRTEYILLEDLIEGNLDALFPGMEVVGAYPFRVIRDADVDIKELEAPDLRRAVEQSLRARKFGAPVLLEVTHEMPAHVRQTLMKLHELELDEVFIVPGLLGMDFLWQLVRLDLPALKFPPHTPYVAEPLAQPGAIFRLLAEQDVLVHHPFDSFLSVEQFVRAAATDPDVIGIKQTLYRVGAESPIVESLLAAAEAGKQVAVMVELKARFDESNNLVWARQLERAGVHVSYGFPEMKVHCKLCSVVRREADGLNAYAHIGTGNYNPVTSRVYTDLGLFTSDDEINRDVSELFNYLTGFSKQTEYRRLFVAPHTLRDSVIERVEREMRLHQGAGNGRIIIKLNSLVDPEVVEALYAASQVGVTIDLIVRGICCLRPGVPGMSENIRVTSIVGRFLEHSRVYYFGNGGTPEAMIGSADLMRRNLDRRIEVMVPVQSPRLVRMMHDHLLSVCLRDTTNAWRAGADGLYTRRERPSGEKEFSSQRYLMAHPFTKMQFPPSRRR